VKLKIKEKLKKRRRGRGLRIKRREEIGHLVVRNNSCRYVIMIELYNLSKRLIANPKRPSTLTLPFSF